MKKIYLLLVTMLLFVTAHSQTFGDSTKVFPNPASNRIKVEPRTIPATATIQIYNAAGEKVFERKFFFVIIYLKNEIDPRHTLYSGLYIVKVTDSDGTFFQPQKLIYIY